MWANIGSHFSLQGEPSMLVFQIATNNIIECKFQKAIGVTNIAAHLNMRPNLPLVLYRLCRDTFPPA